MANMIIVNGNIGKDTVLRTVQNGDRQDSVCDFWMANNKRRRDGSEKTQWIKVTLWREYAAKMAQYLTKGRKVLVTGEPYASSYTKDNTIVPYIGITNATVEFQDSKPEGDAPEALPFEPDAEA